MAVYAKLLIITRINNGIPFLFWTGIATHSMDNYNLFFKKMEVHQDFLLIEYFFSVDVFLFDFSFYFSLF